MRKLYLLIIAGLVFISVASGQAVTVTNPTNTTPNLAATYASLAAAITALNSITSISGPVVITLNAGNPQTAPAGGYVIQFTATTTATNNITFAGNNNIITASPALTVGLLNDGIFKITGADYITLQNFTLQENAANTTTGGATPGDPSTGNNMTEWGVALLRASTSNGAQNNTIQNNTISLNRSYQNTFGIYSNTRHTSAIVTTLSESTSIAGSNPGNKVYSNSISNVMMGISFIGSGNALFQDVGNDVGGSSVAMGNTITNWGGNAAITSYIANSGVSYCIYMNNQVSDNVSYNTINSGTVGATVSVTFTGIRKDYNTTPTGTFTSTISNNTITMSSAFTGGNFECIRTLALNLSTATLNITNNLLHSNAITGAGSTSSFSGIINTSAPGILNITNNTIRGFSTVSTSGAYTAIQNAGSVVTTININNNKVGDAVAGAATYSAATTGGISVIQNNASATTATLNMNNNTIDGFSVVTTGQLIFLYNSSASPANININNNLLGSTTGSLITFSGVQTNTFFGIYNAGGAATGTAIIQNNDITGITFVPTATCGLALMTHSATMLNQTLSNNTFTNLNLKCTGQIALINRNGSMASGQTWTCSNNSIVGTFNKSAAGSTLLCMLGTGSSVNGSTEIETGNNFSNITLTGATTFFAWYNVDGVGTANGPTKTISGNTFTNISGSSSSMTAIYVDRSAAATVANNTISNISGTFSQTGIQSGSLNGQGAFTIMANTISNFSGGISATGIYANSASVPVMNIGNNNISGFSVTASGSIGGIYADAGTVINIDNNLVHDFTAAFPTISGIRLLGNITATVSNNKIYSLNMTGTITSASTVVNGLYIGSGPTTINAYNNFIADLNAPNTNGDLAVHAINLLSTTALSSINLYYNSVYLNASSSSINFGTAGVYHATNTTSTTAALTMINNIIVNTSTPAGGGITSAYRRTDFRLNNYANASDHNLFYAGTPSANRLIFYDGSNSDQTIAAYKTRVSPRDANSISLMPTFVSSTDLHLTAANCRLDGRGIPVSGITNDIDLEARDATYPDIGADEFFGIASTTLPASSVCEDRIVTPVTGTIYSNNACGPIARVVPSGADPVAGNVNVCVTIDATQQYFNGEPYVQRHFDIEPVTSNQTTTSATITLYISNQEFIDYNTNNPVWPKMPTQAGGGNADPNRFNVKVTQFHGVATTSPSSPGNYPGGWALILPGNVLWNGSYWEVTFDVTGFSGFYIHSNMWNAPLPISVNYFTGVKQGSSHLLNWKVTCNSTPSVTMVLERGSDSRNFSSISSTTADAVRCNQPFDHTDADPLSGMNYYRLKMIDDNGAISYSGIVALLNAVKGFDIISIAPNPVTNGHFKLNVTSATASTMQVIITDMQGRTMSRQSIPVISGFSSIPMNVGNLGAGTYSIQAIIAGEPTKMVRFVKQ